MRTRPERVEAEVRFGIVYKAPAGRHLGPLTPCREQPVEIALWPEGAFESDTICVLKHKTPDGKVVKRRTTVARQVQASPRSRDIPRGRNPQQDHWAAAAARLEISPFTG